MGLGKDVIFTAKKRTELPFDVGDIPTIFWKTQDELKKKLHERLAGLVRRYGRQDGFRGKNWATV